MTQLRSAGFSDIGKVRRENEDRMLFDEAVQLFGVADGVGGLPGGAEAAQKTADAVLAAIVEAGDERPIDLATVVARTNETVALLGRRISPVLGIGSTLTFGLFRGGELLLAHVGDSRAFSLRRGELKRITEDHTVENEARRRRARGEVVYYHEAQRGALTRCIGQPSPPEVDVTRLALDPGDRFLFCTDGVTRLLAEADLAAVLAKHEEPTAIVRELVRLAVERGGPDNATAVAVIVDSV